MKNILMLNFNVLLIGNDLKLNKINLSCYIMMLLHFSVCIKTGHLFNICLKSFYRFKRLSEVYFQFKCPPLRDYVYKHPYDFLNSHELFIDLLK